MTTEQNTPGNPDDEHPAQEAHGGSMAPGLVDDTGTPLTSSEDNPQQADDEQVTGAQLAGGE